MRSHQHVTRDWGDTVEHLVFEHGLPRTEAEDLPWPDTWHMTIHVDPRPREQR